MNTLSMHISFKNKNLNYLWILPNEGVDHGDLNVFMQRVL